MDNQGADYYVQNSNESLAETHESAQTVNLDIENMVTVIGEARTHLQNEISEIPANEVSEQDKALMDISASDMTYSFVDTLQHHGIDALDIDNNALSTPRNALETIFKTGDEALRENGFPSPNVELYREAMEMAQSTGQEFQGVVLDMRAAEPLTMRQDLLPRDNIQLIDALDTVTAAPEVEGPVAETQYDVHFMGYPLGHKDIGGLRFETRPSHAFVAVTERGMDPMNPDNVLLATRAGPDNAEQTIFLPDSSLPNDEQSSIEKTNSGNIFVLDDENTRNTDVEHDARFHVEATEVTHDLDTMREMMNNHGQLINNMDIDYEVLNLNSNTYAGDSYRILTGEDAPAFKYEGLGTHYFPAITNDVMNYSNTEFAENFSYQPSEIKHLESVQNQTYTPEEDYSYGMD